MVPSLDPRKHWVCLTASSEWLAAVVAALHPSLHDIFSFLGSQVLGRSWVYQGRPLLDKPWTNRPDSSVLFCLPSNLYTVMMPAALSCQKLGLLKVLTTPSFCVSMSRDLPCTLHTQVLFSPVHSPSLVGPSIRREDFFAGISDYGLPLSDLPLTLSHFLPHACSRDIYFSS